MSSFPFHIKEHVVPGQHVREWARGTANSQEDVVNIHVKQYIPKDNTSPRPGDVTIIGAHANGFPKELYEPLWQDLHELSSSRSGGGDGGDGAGGGFRIRGIWIADVSNQGYSGELNEGVLGDDPSWHDHSRDLLHLTNVFRAEMPQPVVGVGHSFGANILTHLALLHPRLLTTLVLLDATIVPFEAACASGPGKSPARASAFRRDLWPSRRAARDAFARSRFYRAWDPRVLDAWNRHAIRDLPTPLYPELPAGGPASSPDAGRPVTLRTTKHQEVFTFFRPLYPYVTRTPSPSSSSSSSPTYTYTVSKSGAPDFDPSGAPSRLTPDEAEADAIYAFYRPEGGVVVDALPRVRPSVLFVSGGTSDVSTPEVRAHNVSACGTGGGGSGGVEAGRVAEVTVDGRGHLFPMEVPRETAGHTARWIAAEVARWRREQADYEAWTRLPMRQKTTLSQEFIDRVGHVHHQPKKVEPKL